MLAVQTIGSVNVIKVRSSLIGDCVEQCRQRVEDCLKQRKNQLAFDMSESPIVDSDGLEMIVDSQESCLSRGGKLVLIEPQPICKEVLNITGVEDFVAVFDDLRTALKDFAK
ncbi:MAG: STAS domain-containing protein [Planctomycetota bacterium]